MAWTDILITAIITLIIFIISTLPLHFSVKLLGGKTSILHTLIVSLIAGLIIAMIQSFFKAWGSFIAFIALIIIYHYMFRLKWLKSFLAWLLQLIFIAIFGYIAGLIGISLLGISLFW